MKLRRLTSALLAAGMLLLAGCALLPEEERLPEAPVIQKGAGTEFTMVYVQRGDLIDEKRITVAYKAVREERLGFSLGGVHFDKTYVEKGDTVRKGQLLMELEQEALEGEVRAVRQRIDALRLALAQQEQMRDLARERYEVQLGYMDEEELEDAAPMEEVLRPYDREMERIGREIAVGEEELGGKAAGIRERQLRAGMDGTITFLRQARPSDLTKEGETVIIISDSASSMFVADISDPAQFPVGLEVEVTMGQAVYPCRVVSAKEAGAPEQEGKAYLKTDQPTAELSDGDHGYLMLEIGRRENVLYLNEKAVKSMNGSKFVYVQDESGLRSTKEVETGYAAGGSVEIVSGLQEGDAVILK